MEDGLVEEWEFVVVWVVCVSATRVFGSGAGWLGIWMRENARGRDE